MTLLKADSTDALEIARGLLDESGANYVTRYDLEHSIVIVADGDEIWAVRRMTITAPSRSLRLELLEGEPADDGTKLRRCAPRDVLEMLDEMLGTSFASWATRRLRRSLR